MLAGRNVGDISAGEINIVGKRFSGLACGAAPAPGFDPVLEPWSGAGGVVGLPLLCTKADPGPTQIASNAATIKLPVRTGVTILRTFAANMLGVGLRSICCSPKNGSL